ncbi:hypothetical protein [Methylobacterium brachiatum]|uniref:hypothetical protein n=1 Tax=Methylobacterium brachiatum TaxID=269660 RepID=UPI0008DEB22D|nr:hypothetical protein [Methylobacterium brachiatum]SFI05545.1 hypothetical protein SAMN02799642_00565 [Methylobacterium brachiatum]
MPYYSVRITGGDACDQEALNVKNTFNGRDTDYTGSVNFFYVQRNYSRDQLEENIKNMVSNDCDLEVKKILKREYEWKKNQK